MIVLIGGTSSGKTTLAKYLRQNHRYNHVLEQTTRDMREGEKQGEDYWFNSMSSYVQQSMKDELVGALEFRRYQGGEFTPVYYGTRKDHIINAGEKSVLVTNAGAAKLIKQYNEENNNIFKIFVVHVKINPDEQRRRLAARGDSPAEIEKRTASDAEALTDVSTYADYTVDNSFSSPGCVCEEIVQAYERYLGTLGE